MFYYKKYYLRNDLKSIYAVNNRFQLAALIIKPSATTYHLDVTATT